MSSLQNINDQIDTFFIHVLAAMDTVFLQTFYFVNFSAHISFYVQLGSKFGGRFDARKNHQSQQEVVMF